MLKKIAVTGGIASGKTTVCQFFKELGATVISADEIVHHLIQFDLKEKLIKEFGPQIVKNGSIDHKALANATFNNRSRLEKLEALIHPSVLQKIEEEYGRAQGSCFVVEIPLLYEIGAEDGFDLVIAVLTDANRAKKRFKHGATEYELRMERQLKPEEKANRADVTIANNGSLNELREQVIACFQTIQ